MLEACFIRVEVKKRELISRTDLAIEMARKGIPVILGEAYSNDEFEKIGVNKGYFFGKCAQTHTVNHFRPLLEKGWVFGALDEEGLLPMNLERFARYRFSDESAEVFNDVFFFGDAQKDMFEKIFGAHESFIASGNPRTDMWQSNCYNIHNSVANEIAESLGDFVLFPLNFSVYTNKERNAVLSDDLLKYRKDLAKNSEILFDSFCKLSQRIVDEVGINVVIRPHPADDPNKIKELMFKHGIRSDRVKCIAKNEVFPWISAAQLVIHNCCTTSLEAGFLGTPVVTYAPSGTLLLQDDSDGLHKYMNKLFTIALNENDILNILKSDQELENEKFRSRISDWGRLNLDHSGQISSFIAERIVERNNFSPKFDKLSLRRRFDFKRAKNEAISKIVSLKGQNQRRVTLQKFPRTSVNEIEMIIDNICKYRGYVERPRVYGINSTLFGIIPNNTKSF